MIKLELRRKRGRTGSRGTMNWWSRVRKPRYVIPRDTRERSKIRRKRSSNLNKS